MRPPGACPTGCVVWPAVTALILPALVSLEWPFVMCLAVLPGLLDLMSWWAALAVTLLLNRCPAGARGMGRTVVIQALQSGNSYRPKKG